MSKLQGPSGLTFCIAKNNDTSGKPRLTLRTRHRSRSADFASLEYPKLQPLGGDGTHTLRELNDLVGESLGYIPRTDRVVIGMSQSECVMGAHFHFDVLPQRSDSVTWPALRL